MTAARRSRGYVDGLWGQVHFRSCGDGAPLLLLHQTSVSSLMFERGLPLLAARGFRAIAIDTPGYGQSDAPPSMPTMREYAGNLGRVIDALGLARPHILGHHTGAGIAAIFAAQHPDRIDRLILQGVPWFDAATRAHFSDDWFADLSPRADGGHLLAAWQQRVSVSPGWTDLATMHRLTAEMLRVNDRYADGFKAALVHDLEPDLRAIRAPTLNFINRGDSAFGLSKATARLRPDWPFVVHAGGTNDYIDEAPEAWADIVAAFLHPVAAEVVAA